MTRLLTVVEASEFLRVHPETIKRYTREGRIKAYFSGNRLVLKEKDVEAFLIPAVKVSSA